MFFMTTSIAVTPVPLHFLFLLVQPKTRSIEKNSAIIIRLKSIRGGTRLEGVGFQGEGGGQEFILATRRGGPKVLFLESYKNR